MQYYKCQITPVELLLIYPYNDKQYLYSASRLLSKSLILGSAMFSASFNLVTRVGLQEFLNAERWYSGNQ